MKIDDARVLYKALGRAIELAVMERRDEVNLQGALSERLSDELDALEAAIADVKAART